MLHYKQNIFRPELYTTAFNLKANNVFVGVKSYSIYKDNINF